MIDSFFAAMLRCDDCSHSVDTHSPDGCVSPGCGCKRSREGVIEANIVIEIADRRRSFGDTIASP